MSGEKDSLKKSLPIIPDKFLFFNIFRTFRLAIQPTKLIIALLALIVICLAGWIMDFTKTVRVSNNGTCELQIYISRPQQLPSFIETYSDKGSRKGVFATVWSFTASKFHNTANALLTANLSRAATNIADCCKALGWLIKYHLLYLIIFGLTALAVLSIGGGGLCRITALQLAQGEKPGLTEAMRFSTQKFKNLFASPLVLTGIIIFIGLLISVIGLLGNIPYIGEFIVAVSMPLLLLAGLITAAFIIALIAGFNLMFAAVAYDGFDFADTVSHCVRYVYTRPWRMLFYTSIAAVYGSICYIFVRLFAFLTLSVTRQFLHLAMRVGCNSGEASKLTAIWPAGDFVNLAGSAQQLQLNWSQSCAAFLIHLCVLLVIAVVVSFIMSFYFSANTIIYANLRSITDGKAMEDIYKNIE